MSSLTFNETTQHLNLKNKKQTTFEEIKQNLKFYLYLYLIFQLTNDISHILFILSAAHSLLRFISLRPLYSYEHIHKLQYNAVNIIIKRKQNIEAFYIIKLANT